MEFEWDEAKRLSNLTKHGIDFQRARQLFDGRPVYTARSTFAEEVRWVTTGTLDADVITVVWTDRFSAKRIISARRARSNEDRAYRALHGGGDR